MPQFGKIIYRILFGFIAIFVFHRVFSNQDGPSRFFPALGFRRYVIFQDVPFHTNHFRGCSKIMVPENCLYATFSRTFRAPAESGQGIMIMFSCASMFINSGMQTFREPFARPFAVLRHCSKTHTPISADVTRILLEWVLERLPFRGRKMDGKWNKKRIKKRLLFPKQCGHLWPHCRGSYGKC